MLKKLGHYLLSALPYVIVSGGLLTFVAGGIGSLTVANQNIKDFAKSKTFLERQEKDIKIAEEKFASGQISEEEYVGLMQEYNSQTYAEKILFSPENKEIYQVLKQKQIPYNICIGVGAGVTMASYAVLMIVEKRKEEVFDWSIYDKGLPLMEYTQLSNFAEKTEKNIEVDYDNLTF